MRVTSSLWVSALVRRCNGVGAVATVARHGAEEAGAIFIIVDRLNDAADLYGPAPQSAFDEYGASERKFQLIQSSSLAEISERLDREAKFDPDVWVVAVEDREGRTFFDVVPGD